MANWLDRLPEFNNKAILVQSTLGYQMALAYLGYRDVGLEIVEVGLDEGTDNIDGLEDDDGPFNGVQLASPNEDLFDLLSDQITWYNQLLGVANDTDQSEDTRLKCLTELVDQARLNEVPLLPYNPVIMPQTDIPPSALVIHNETTGIEGPGFIHITPLDLVLIRSAKQGHDSFAQITGSYTANASLVGGFATKENLISPSNNPAQFWNGNKVFAAVAFNQLTGVPTTLAGYGITASDTLFNNKYLQLGSQLAGLSTVSGTPLTTSTTVIEGFGRLQNQVSARELSLGNPNVDGYALLSLANGTRYWAQVPTGTAVTNISLTGTNGITGSVTITAGVADIVAGTNVTGMLIGDGTAILAATEMTDYIGITGATNGDTILFTGGVATWAPGLFNPMDTLGDIIYGLALGVTEKLAGNTTTTNKFLRSTGVAGVATAPSWEALTAGDIPNILISQVTNLQTELDNKLGTALNSGLLYIGSGTNAATPTAISQDILIDNLGVATIQPNVVGFSKMTPATSQGNFIVRWSAGGGDWQQGSFGTGLTLSAMGVLSSGGLSNPMTTIGDIIYGSTTGVPTSNPARLGIGSAGQVLTVSGGGLPSWVTPTSGTGDVSWIGTGSAVVTGIATYSNVNGKIIQSPTNARISSTGDTVFKSLQIIGTGGSGFIQLTQQASAASGVAGLNTIYADSSGRIAFRKNAEAFDSIIAFAATTGQTYTLPNISGTVALLANPASFTSVTVGTASSLAGDLVFQNATNSNTQTIRGSNPNGSDIVYVLPSTAPTVNQVLQSSAPSAGVATLSWTTAGSGNVIGPGPTVSANNFAVYSGTGGLTIAQPTGASLDTSGNAAFLSVKVTGTNGAGHIHMRHQASAVSGQGSNNTIYALDAGTNGFGFIIDNAAYASQIIFGATVPRTYTLPDLAGTIAIQSNPASFTALTASSLVSSVASFALLNTTATTINFGGAATTLNIGGAASSVITVGSGASSIVNLGGGTAAADLRFLEPSVSGTDYTAFRAVAQSASLTYSWPAVAPTSGQVLSAGAISSSVYPLSWASVANAALSNLASVAINTALLPNAAAGFDFGSATLPWKDIWLAGTSGTPATNNFKITGVATAARVITIPDSTTTLAGLAVAQTFTAAQTFNQIQTISGTSVADQMLKISNTSTTFGAQISFTGNRNWTMGTQGSSGTILAGGFIIVDNTAGAIARIVIDSVGNAGFGINAPSANMHIVQRTAIATGLIKGFIYTGVVNTNQTTATEISGATWTMAGRQWATGAIATQREFLIDAPTYSFVGASTITNAATLAITGAPIAGTNATITNRLALWVQGGKVRLDGAGAWTGLQTGSAGLASGDLYVDTAANILTNGDLIVARKA